MEDIQFRKIRESRSTRRIEAFLHSPRGQEIRAIVTNISNRGCRLKAKGPLSIDELVRIEVPRVGSVAATIRWVSNGEVGIEFIPDSDIWDEASDDDCLNCKGMSSRGCFSAGKTRSG